MEQSFELDVSTANSLLNETDEEDNSDSSEKLHAQKSVKKEKKQKGSMLTGRGVTMQMLIEEGILEPGEKVLSIDYLGKKFEGDLLADGQIKWCETRQTFSSPSSWAMYCKKLVNPTKKSGCGWASVRYKGRKLDQFKPTWFKTQKQKQNSNTKQFNAALSTSSGSSTKRMDLNPDNGADHMNTTEISQRTSHSVFCTEPEREVPSVLVPTHLSKKGHQNSMQDLNSRKRPSGRAAGKTPGRPTGRHLKTKTQSDSKDEESSNVHNILHSVDVISPPRLHESCDVSDDDSNHPADKPSQCLSDGVIPAYAQTQIPGRTGNVMTFSEALELIKNQSVKKMEQANASDRVQVVNVCNTTPKMSSMRSVHTRVYKRKPGRPPKDPSKLAAISMQQAMQRKSSYSTLSTSSRGRGRRISRTRMSIKHANVHAESDPLTLVECAQFASIGKIQPFSVTISTNSLLLIDFHCHLSTSEVTGYLAGKWDSTIQHLKICRAYPCKCRIADKNDARQIETQINHDMEQLGLTPVGWYHSHPFCQPDPTLQDIKSQLQYQQMMEHESASEPCIGLIVSPYDSHKKEANFKAFWVQAHSQMHPEKLALPLGMSFTTQQDQRLSQDIVDEMVSLVNFYKGNPDSIKFTDIWTSEATYLDKIKHSAIRKFPQDQTDGKFLDFITKLLVAASS